VSKEKQGGFSGSRFLIILAACMILFMLGFGVAYKFAISSSNTDNNLLITIDPDKAISVDIPLGANTESIAAILKEKEIIKSPFYFKLLSKVNGYDGMYKSGVHMLAKDLDYEDVMKILTSNPVSVKIRIPEGSTINQVADTLLSKKLISDKAKFIEDLNVQSYSYKFFEDLPKRDSRYEGYLFPDTYELGLNANEKDIVKMVLDNFNNKFRPDFYEKAKNLGLSVDQVITIASILEKEANNYKDRAMIAQIFYNRLNSKDKTLNKLQSCATVQYIFFNRKTGVPEADLKRIAQGKLTNEITVDDPYNTYKNPGLPVGPICSPSLESIEAALNPDLDAKTNGYYYFVAKGDGTTDYSKTFAEHEAKRAMYQK
jgi:conserved hypothetical protein, YceG family